MKRLYGLTIETIDDAAYIYSILAGFKNRCTVRLVIQPGTEPDYYWHFARDCSKVADIMLCPFDSSAVANISLKGYKNRVRDFVNKLEFFITGVECGNEVNGEWLGRGVSQKVAAAMEIAHAYRKKTAITYFLDGNNPDQMQGWAEEHSSLNPDQAFVSWYPFCSPGSKPSLSMAFQRLGAIFPKAELGFGEYGTEDEYGKQGTKEQKIALVKKIEAFYPNVENWVGFGGYWSAAKDVCVNQGLLTTFREIWG